MLELSGLTKRFGGVTAVDRLDLKVRGGEIFALLGPNGAGKTTAVRMIAGLLRPTSGVIRIAGFDAAAEGMLARARLGFVPDIPFLYDKLTVVETLDFAASVYGEAGADERGPGRRCFAVRLNGCGTTSQRRSRRDAPAPVFAMACARPVADGRRRPFVGLDPERIA